MSSVKTFIHIQCKSPILIPTQFFVTDRILRGPSQEKNLFLSFFLEGSGEILALKGPRIVTSCIQDLVAFVLHDAFSISDLMLDNQEIYLVYSIRFVQQLGPFATRCKNVDIKKVKLSI